MSDTLILAVVPLVLMALIFAGAPVAINMGIAGFIGILMLGESPGLTGTIVIEATSQIGLLAIPFYLLVGVLLDVSGIGIALVRFMMTLFGHIRGSMVVVLGGASVVFGGVSGSGPADASALSSIFARPMSERGYPKAYTGAMSAAGGTLGLILPPSAGYILYSIISGNASIPDMFIAGIGPGLLLAVGFIIAGLIRGRGFDTGKTDSMPPVREILRTAPGALVALGAPVVLLGGIYSGLFTVSEAAGVGALYAILAGTVVFRRLTLKDWFSVCVTTGVATGTIFLILAGASVFRWLVTVMGWAVSFSDLLTGVATNATAFLFLAILVVLICGIFIDGISMYFLLVPLFMPGVIEYGIDPVVFGVIFTIALALGLIHPPLGIDIFAAAAVLGETAEAITKYLWPTVVAGLVVLALVTIFPGIITFLL